MIDPPTEHKASAFADWLESTLLFTNKKRVSWADLERIFDQVEVDDIEASLSNIGREIDRRTKYTGAYYPLELERRALSRRKGWKGSLVYSFLLLVSLNQHYSRLRFRGSAAHKPAELFEFLTHHALRQYLKGDSMKIGAPRKPPLPNGLRDTVKIISERTNERFSGRLVPTRTVGDHNLDIISWSPFRDRRPGQLILLGQCAIGIDWDDKLSDLNVEVWSKHIEWAVRPVRAFAVPFIHEDDEAWDYTSSEGGIIFDRARISSLVRPTDLPRDLYAEIKGWCEERIESLPRWEL